MREGRRLVLLRHAKSSWKSPDLDDHERPLAPRGRREAAEVGRHFRAIGFTPELVLCSSAVRTRETLDLLEIDSAAQVLVEDGLYAASARLLLTRLRRIGPEVTTVLAICHNPGISDLVSILVSGDRPIPSFTTAAFANLSVRLASWGDLVAGKCELDAFVTPADIR